MSSSPVAPPVAGVSLNSQQWKIIWIGLLSGGLWVLLVCYVIIFAWFIARMFSGMGDDDEEEEEEKNKPDPVKAMSALVPLIGSASAFGGNVASAGFQVVLDSGRTLLTMSPIFIALGSGLITFSVLAYYTQPIMTVAQQANINFVQPPFAYFIHPVGISLVGFRQTLFGLIATATRVVEAFLFSPLRALLQCSLSNLGNLIFQGGVVVLNFTWSSWFWILSNVVLLEWPGQTPFHELGIWLTMLWTGPFECFCQVLNYVVGGIGRSFGVIAFANIFTNLINFVWVFFMATIVRPILYNQRPSIIRVYQLQVLTVTSTMQWVENFTTYQFDIYVMGGNGTLVAMVNGSAPLPTDDLQYLVFFLRSHWAETVGNIVNALVAIIWEIFNLAFQADLIFTPTGYTVFQWNMLRNTTLAAISDFATIINVAPVCQNAPQFNSIPFGNLVSILSGIVWFFQIVSDVVFGEIWFLFNGNFPGEFLASYFMSNALPLGMFTASIAEFAAILGCSIAYLDKATGQAIAGILVSVIVYLPKIPFQILAFARYAIEFPGSTTIFDTISLTPLQQALNQVAAFAEIFYQFQPGATALTCPTSVTFFCALGYGFQNFLAFLFDFIILGFQIIINLLKVIIGSLPSNTQATVTVPNFAPMLAHGYAATCRLGVSLATMIPVQIPCMIDPNTGQTAIDRERFCAVSEFPTQANSNVGICFATTLCKVGNWLMIPIEIFTIFLSSILTFNFSNSNLIVETVKKVLDVIIFRIMPPICPFAHFVDCLFSAIFTGIERSVSDFFCLITGAAVYLFRTLGDVIIRLLAWFIQVLIFVFGGFTQGDAGRTLVNLITEFLDIMTATLAEVILAIINIVLSIVINILVFLCRVVNFISFGALAQQCDALEASLQDSLGPGQSVFLQPDTINYKRNVETKRETRRPGILETLQCGTLRLESRLIQTLEELYKRYPSAYHPKKMLPEWMQAYVPRMPRWTDPFAGIETENETPRETIHTRKRAAAEYAASTASLGDGVHMTDIDRVLTVAFGHIPEDPSIRMRYFFEAVPWSRSSNCYTLFGLLKDVNVHNLTASDRIFAMDCLKAKAVAVGLKSNFGPLAWLPEDIFYNPVIRTLTLTVTFARFTTAAVQYALDRSVPVAMLFTDSYQSQWRLLHLSVDHYNRDWKPLYPGVGRPPQEYMPLLQKIQEATLSDYLRRNFGGFYVDSEGKQLPPNVDPILQPLETLYAFAGEMLLDAGERTYNLSQDVLYHHNNTLPVYPSGSSYPTDAAYQHYYYYGQNMDNYTEVEIEFGPEVMIAYNLRRQTTDAFASWSTLFSELWTMATHFRHLWNDRQMGQNFKRALVRTSAVPTALFWEGAGDRLWNQAVREFGLSIDHMYREAPVFRPRVWRLAPHVATTVAELAASVVGANITAPKPWCVNVYAQQHNLTWEETVHQFGADCRNETIYGNASMATNSPMTWWNMTTGTSSPLNLWYHVTRPRNRQAELNRRGLGLVGQGIQRFVSTMYSRMMDTTTMEYMNMRDSHKWQQGVEAERQRWQAENAAALVAAQRQEQERMRIANLERWEAGEDRWSLQRQRRTFPSIEKMILRDQEMQRIHYGYGRASEYGASWPIVQEEYNEWLSAEQDGQNTILRRLAAATIQGGVSFTGVLKELQEALAMPPELQESRDRALRNAHELLNQESDRNRIDLLFGVHARMQPFVQQGQSNGAGLLFQPRSQHYRQWFGLRHEKDVVRLYSHYRLQGIVDTPTSISYTGWQMQQEGGISLQDAREGFESVYVVKRDITTGMFREAHHLILDRHAPGNSKGMSAATAERLPTDSEDWVLERVAIVDHFETRAAAAAATDGFVGSTSIFVDFANLLSLQCTTNITELCEQCFGLDGPINVLVSRAIFLYTYYVDIYPAMMGNLFPQLQYSFTLGVPGAFAISGNGTNSPWYPALNEPIATYFQMSPSEVANGLSYTFWVEQMFGVAFPTYLITTGPLFTALLEYRAARQMGFNTNITVPVQPFYAILDFFDFFLRIPIAQFLDTIFLVVDGGVGSIVTWIIDHFLVCDYQYSLSCTSRNYSWFGGLLVAGAWELGAALIVVATTQALPIATAALLGMLALSFIPFHAMITYNWSLRCVVLPQCYVTEAWNVYSFSINPRCSGWYGTFVRNRTYDGYTCGNGNLTWAMADCQELGFRTVFDSLNYFQLWLGGDLGISQWLRPLYEFFMGPIQPSIDFTGWDTDPVLYRNYAGCSIVMAVPSMLAAAIVLLATGVVATALVLAIPAILGAGIYLVGFLLMFTFLCLVELDQIVISQAVQRTQRRLRAARRKQHQL